MFATLAFLISLTAAPAAAAPADDLCAVVLADAPNLEGAAIDYAEACAQAAARARLAGGIVEHGARLARPAWAFEEPRTSVELDAELASMARISPFAADEAVGPFAEGGR